MPLAILIARRIGMMRLMVVGAAFGIPANICFATTSTAAGLFTGQIFMGAVWGVFAALGIIVAQRLLPTAVATASAIFISSTALATALGGAAGRTRSRLHRPALRLPHPRRSRAPRHHRTHPDGSNRQMTATSGWIHMTRQRLWGHRRPGQRLMAGPGPVLASCTSASSPCSTRPDDDRPLILRERDRRSVVPGVGEPSDTGRQLLGHGPPIPLGRRRESISQ